MSNEKLEELYYKYYHLVKDTAFKVLHDHEVTEDVCHDVFLKLSDEWIEADLTPRDRENYLRLASIRKAIDYYRFRKMNNHVSYNENSLKYELIDETDEELLTMQRLFVSELFRELKEYNEDWYMALLRREVYHEPVDLIAREMNASSIAVRTWIYRGKKWIQERHGDEYKSFL